MMQDILLPDTGSNAAVEVIEVHVKPGDTITQGTPLLTLESDKATIDVPAPCAGTIEKLLVSVGSKITTGTPIAVIAHAIPADKAAPEISSNAQPAEKPTPKPSAPEKNVAESTKNDVQPATIADTNVLAGPGVRRLARLLGAELTAIQGSGANGRITVDDVHNFVKDRLTQSSSNMTGTGLPTMPVIDYAQYGPINSLPLTRIKQQTAQNLSRNWLLAPHVTQFDAADITELEIFRKQAAAEHAQSSVKLTPLVFIMKALVQTLKHFPSFNASLDHTGKNLIVKNYYHIGIAVDTPEGLVVPVIRDVDEKSLLDLAKELAEVSHKAREKKLTAQDMQGSSFTLSSLGGIGGTAFTPIINLPNVAILGVSKSSIQPKYDGTSFQPRLMLPLSLSYDHRVIDGAEAARFITQLSAYLADIRRLLL